MKTLTKVIGLTAALWMASLLPGLAGAIDGQQYKHNCSFCHNLHGGSYSQLSDFAVVEDLCVSCHGAAGPAQVDRDGTLVDVPKQEGVHVGPRHAAADTTTCWDCHDHEGSAGLNLRMIPEVRTLKQGGSATITFTANAAQADFIGTEGVCYVCHTLPETQANGFAGHNGPDVCTNCHSHDGGFQGVGGACTSCHNSGRGNHREIVSEFDRPSHHVQLGGAGADIPEEDCLICHDQATVFDSLPHPRRGSDYVVLINQNDSSAIQYEAGVDPTSTLTPFCLSCHDAGGADLLATPTEPFSDGITRPEVDVTAWNASSHAGGSACADCHEGHGSEKVTLLAPGDVAPDPTTKVEEEEGFCFNCHTSTGPASTDIEGQFAPAIWWTQEPVGGLDGSPNPNLNDRHDVQHEAQTRSGAKVECVNCHNPHTASSTQKYILDPDPADGHVPGTDWYYYAVAADTLSEFCLDCHDGSFPTGVSDHATYPLTNIHTAHTVDGMGNRYAGSGAELILGTGWEINDTASAPVDSTGITDNIACAACHEPHPSYDPDARAGAGGTNLFSIVDQTYSPDGLTPLQGYTGCKGQTCTQSANYSFDLIAGDEPENGATFCMSCHSRTGMLGSRNCFDSCHRHGDGGRW